MQGMNFIAGCLLLFMEEQDAFWCLTTIVEKLLPGYFDTTMAGSQANLSRLQIFSWSSLTFREAMEKETHRVLVVPGERELPSCLIFSMPFLEPYHCINMMSTNLELC